jgi:carnitine 3-dehydrogenase
MSVAEMAIAGIRRVAVVGCGTVGASWAALFLSHGLDVLATDVAPDAEESLRRHVGRAQGQLAELGCRGTGRLAFHASLAQALEDADLVQENAPENEELKRHLLAEIDGLVPPETIVASSTSALLRSRIVSACRHPSRHIVAHPFNPPHLMPLVEILGGDEAVVERACSFYAALGRRPLVLRKETEGHLANRLASALFREAAHLIEQGVASVEDVDAAVSYGPGLRWAIMGPCLTYHLGGGAGGISSIWARARHSAGPAWATRASARRCRPGSPKACSRRRPAAPSRTSRPSATVRWSASCSCSAAGRDARGAEGMQIPDLTG